MMTPRGLSRAAGVFYLMDLAFGPGMLAIKKIVVPHDAVATANNLLLHRSLLELGFAGNMIAIATYIAVTALLYHLFRPLSRPIALSAAFFSLVGCTIIATGNVLYLAPLALPSSTALLSFTLYSQCFRISIVFFGFYCLLTGYLTYKSGFLPQGLGIGMMIAGFGWLTFMSPSLLRLLSPYVFLAGAGELAFMLWLLFAGVDSARWNKRAETCQ